MIIIYSIANVGQVKALDSDESDNDNENDQDWSFVANKKGTIQFCF